jgi:hypothetical protein
MYQPKGVHSSSLARNNSLAHGHHLDCVASTMDPNGGNNLDNPSLASKQRLRWTHELHERFVDAVAQLGGPDSESAQPLPGQLDLLFVVAIFLLILSSVLIWQLRCSIHIVNQKSYSSLHVGSTFVHVDFS